MVRAFFRRIEVAGREHIPAGGPVLFILNHPNALVDPAVLMVHAGRPVTMLAKEPLFRMPILGRVIRAMDAIPVYRQQDQADMAKNRATFDAARSVLRRGGSIAIFPEGRSHTEPRLMPFRTGAARIALGAAEAGGLDVVPAGLFYTEKTRFRSGVLLCFGPPIHVDPVEPGPDGEPPRETARALTERFQAALGELTLQADTHEALALATLIERLVTTSSPSLPRELYDRVNMQKRLVAGYGRLREEAPHRLARLQSRITRYQAAMREAELTPDLLPARGYRTRRVLTVALRTMAALFFLMPVAIVGAVIHLPGWHLSRFAGERVRQAHPDGVATVKAIGGVVFYGLTWIGLGVLAGWRWGPWWGLLTAVAAPVTGWIALATRERLDRFAGRARGVMLALTGPRRFLRLQAERRAIRDEVFALGEEYGL